MTWSAWFSAHGAKGDGITDDTAAIQAAYDALYPSKPTVRRWAGRVVLCGLWLVLAALNVQSVVLDPHHWWWLIIAAVCAWCAVDQIGLLRKELRNGSNRGAASDHPHSTARDTKPAASGGAGAGAGQGAGGNVGQPTGPSVQITTASLGLSPAKDLPEVEQEEPIRTWKQAALVRNGQNVELRPMAITKATILPDAEATCASYGSNAAFLAASLGDHHQCPKPGCTCGFYAYKERPAPATNAFPYTNSWGTNTVILEVELSGTVIECETGYRAQYQRVLGVHIPGRCSNLLCDEPAVAVVFSADGEPGRPVCATHRERDSWDAVTLAEIGNALGIECCWDLREAPEKDKPGTASLVHWAQEIMTATGLPVWAPVDVVNQYGVKEPLFADKRRTKPLPNPVTPVRLPKSNESWLDFWIKPGTYWLKSDCGVCTKVEIR